MPRTAPPMPPPPAGANNRTDLNVPGPVGTPPGQGQPNGQPIAVPTGTPYGEATQLQQAQQAVPLPQAPGAPSSPPPPAPGGAAPPVDMAAAMEAAKNFQMPDMGGLTRPTERPGEAVTAGLPLGPPPSPGTGAPAQETGAISSMLAKMAAATGSAAISQLAGRATAVGQ